MEARTVQGATASGASPTFARQASGLIKTGTPWRLFVMAILLNGVGVFMATIYLFGPGAFPGMSLLWAILIAGTGNVITNVAYAYLAGAYPRSGGEYVYISRVLNPFLGFVINFGAFIAYVFYAATGAFLIFTFALGPVLSVWGSVTGSAGLVSAGEWFADTENAWLCGGIVTALAGVLVALGMKAFYRTQAILWWVGGAGFIVLLVVFGFSSNADFVSGINAYGEATADVPNAYDVILANAREAGFESGTSLWATLAIAAVMTAVAGGLGYIGGEVRNPLRTQLIGQVAGSLTFVAIVFFVALLISKVVGFEWNNAAAYLAVQAPDDYPLDQSPVYTFFSFLVTGSPVILALMAVGLVMLTFFLVPSQILYPTRMILAWSLDRLVPSRLADVSERTHAPVLATIVVIVVAEILLWLFATDQITYVNPILIVGVVWGTSALTAALFPYMRRSKAVFEASGANHRVAGIPVITIFGTLGTLYWAFALFIALGGNSAADTLGTNTTSNIRIAVIIFLIPIVAFPLIKLYRRRQGIRLDAAFNELPPD